jgi:hypothetical protein
MNVLEHFDSQQTRDPEDIPSGAGQGDKDGQEDTSSGGAPQDPD